MWLEGEEGAVNYQAREDTVILWGGDDAQAGRGWIMSPGRRRPTPEISPPFRPSEDLLRDKGFCFFCAEYLTRVDFVTKSLRVLRRNRTVRPVLQDRVWGVEEFEFDYHDVNDNPG